MDMETLHSEMLAEMSDSYQKTAGFAAYDLTRAFAMGCVSLAEDVAEAVNRSDVRNLIGADLDMYVTLHAGMERKYAQRATATLKVVSGHGSIYAGALFSTNSGIGFEAIADAEVDEGDTFTVMCTMGGEAGNAAANTITAMPITIAGIGAVTNESAAEGGVDGETDEALLERFMYKLQTPANGANAASYKQWAEQQDGVGRALVVPHAGGAGTVTVYICNSSYGVPSSALVTAVQNYIDPNANGDGSGAAPIGAVCTVSAASAKAIAVTFGLTVSEGYDADTVKAEVKEKILDYLHEVCLQSSRVVYQRIIKSILTTEGAESYSTLKVNNSTANVSLTTGQIPVGTVTIS